jgi:hypothetical protein
MYKAQNKLFTILAMAHCVIKEKSQLIDFHVQQYMLIVGRSTWLDSAAHNNSLFWALIQYLLQRWVWTMDVWSNQWLWTIAAVSNKQIFEHSVFFRIHRYRWIYAHRITEHLSPIPSIRKAINCTEKNKIVFSIPMGSI